MLILTMLFTLPFPVFAESEVQTSADFQTDYVEGEIIVQYIEEPQSDFGIMSFFSEPDTEATEPEPELIEVESQAEMVEVLEELEQDPNVLYAEPNYIAHAMAGTSDPRFSEQWGLQAIDAPIGWADTDLISASGSVKIAVLDTGVYAGHADLAGRILAGKNFADVNSLNIPYTDINDSSDDHGHGTAVAGIICAAYDNGIGVSGAAGPYNIKVLPVKVLKDSGTGTIFDIAEGVRWAADQPGVSVINMSLGAETYSHTLADAVQYAQEKDILIVAAAGNDGKLTNSVYPAAYPGVLAVGAIDQSGGRAYYSNYGDVIDLVAPGTEILSTKWSAGSVYGSRTGTSMAAPFVSGAAGLYCLLYPDASATEISDILTSTASDVAPLGWDMATGYGVVNIAAALNMPVESDDIINFMAPDLDSEVTGKITVAVQAIQPELIDRVDFYIDDATVLSNRLAQVARNDLNTAQVNYSLVWDSMSAYAADGEHTLIAQAYLGSNKVGDAASRTISINNVTQNGLLLQVLDPGGGYGINAEVSVYRKLYDIENQPYYENVFSGNANKEGALHIPAAEIADLKKYEVIVTGTFDAEKNGLWQSYAYHRTYESPQSDIIENGTTAVLNFSMEDLNGQALEYANYDIGIKDSDGFLIAGTGLIYESPEETLKLYIDKGNYDAFAYWDSEEVNQLCSSLNITTSYSGLTYLLTKEDINVTGDMALDFDNADSGQLNLELQTDQDSLTVLLENDLINKINGEGIETKSSSGGIVLTAGEYNLSSSMNQDEWFYEFVKNGLQTITKGAVGIYRCGGGNLSMTMTADNIDIKENDSFVADAEIVDSYGNILTEIYNSNDSEYRYPNFAISTKTGTLVASKMNSSTFYSPIWETAAPEGEYNAKLELSNPGPVNSNNPLSASLDFTVTENTQPIQIIGKSGTQILEGKIWLFKWETETVDNQEYGSWSILDEIDTDSNGAFNIPVDLDFATNNKNIAVICDASTSGSAVFGYKQFTTLNDLNNFSLENAEAVNFNVTNASGTAISDSEISFAIAAEADGDNSTVEFLGNFSGTGDLYLIPGSYEFTAAFSEAAASLQSQYLLTSEEAVNIANEAVEVNLNGANASLLTLDIADGYDLGFLDFYSEFGYSFGLVPEDVNNEIRIYISEGLYYQIAAITKKDPEQLSEDTYYSWTHLLEMDNPDLLLIEKDFDYVWSLGGPFTADLDLAKSALLTTGTLTGDTIIKDASGNRQIGMSTEEIETGVSSIDEVSNNTYGYEQSPIAKFGHRLSNGKFISENDDMTYTWEEAAPLLGIYRQNSSGETLVFNQESDGYYNSFSESLGAWGTAGSYRAQLSIGIGPEGVIKTGTAAKYYFAISNPVVVSVGGAIGGGGGGGGSVILAEEPVATSENVKQISAQTGGNIEYEGISITVPPAALPSDATLSVQKLQAEDSGTIIPEALNLKLGSDIYAITTDGTRNFGDKNITIKIPYDPEKVADGEFATIHYYNETTKTWVAIVTKRVKENGVWYAVTEVNHLTDFAVFATETEAIGKVIRLTIGQPSAILNGEAIELDAAPYVDTQVWRTLIPVRFVSEALGAEVEWVGEKNQVKIVLNGQTIILTIDSSTVQINGADSSMDCRPRIVDPGRTMVPVRFISESLGANVYYDAENQAIHINY